MFTTAQLILFIFFCTNVVLGLNYSVRFLLTRNPNEKPNYIVLCVTLSSTLWSLGLGLMSMQNSETAAYLWRCIGILGTFFFMVSIQKALCNISDILPKYKRILMAIAYSGIFIYAVHIKPGNIVFVKENIGYTFYFTPCLINTLYSLYYAVVSCNIFLLTIYIVKKHPLKQVRSAGRRFIIVEILIFGGTVLDMVLPYLGIPAIPGSAIIQFWGVMVFWYAIHEMYKSRITISNMSEYIYYSLNVPVLVFDSQYRLQIMNDASTTFFERSHLLPQKKEHYIQDFFDTDERIFQFQGNSNTASAQCFINYANCELSISKIKDSYQDVIGYILIINDLTEHNLVIHRLEQAKLAADSANLSKSLFLANMSHEIRTPMNAILGFSELALYEDIDDHSREYFTEIKNAGELLLNIINDILSISKIELGKQDLNCRNYDLTRIVKDVELIINMQSHKKNLNFQTKIDPDMPTQLYGDTDRIREILINLLSNSVKYTNCGHVILEVSMLSAVNNKVQIQFRVQDSGIGIKEEDLSSIFDKFERVDAKLNSTTEGTGLGLPITKGLVELMGGTISVESQYGLGSCFTVVLPQKLADASQNLPEQTVTFIPDILDPSPKSFRFLAVDDNRVNLKVISNILTRYHIQHDTAKSGFEALELCKSTAYDLIFMDQMMPEMDGIETMKQIRKLPGYHTGSSSKIIALTANVVDGAKEELIAQGFDGFLGKPIDLKSFEKILHETLPN